MVFQPEYAVTPNGTVRSLLPRERSSVRTRQFLQPSGKCLEIQPVDDTLALPPLR